MRGVARQALPVNHTPWGIFSNLKGSLKGAQLVAHVASLNIRNLRVACVAVRQAKCALFVLCTFRN